MPTVDEIVLFVHILGACVWIGGSISLGIVAAAVHSVLGSDRQLYSRIMSKVARSLGWTMWGALLVTIVTGLYNLTWFLGTPTPSLSTILANSWLTAKILLVLFLVLTSAVHSFVLGPAIRRAVQSRPAGGDVSRLRRLDRSISILSVLITLGVLFAAVMLAN
jgi:uncharacterized membrane protein